MPADRDYHRLSRVDTFKLPQRKRALPHLDQTLLPFRSQALHRRVRGPCELGNSLGINTVTTCLQPEALSQGFGQFAPNANQRNGQIIEVRGDLRAKGPSGALTIRAPKIEFVGRVARAVSPTEFAGLGLEHGI